MRLADHLHLSRIADDDEPPAAFDQVEPATPDPGHQRGATDIAHGTANDPAHANGLGREEIVEPCTGVEGGAPKHLHDGKSAVAG